MNPILLVAKLVAKLMGVNLKQFPFIVVNKQENAYEITIDYETLMAKTVDDLNDVINDYIEPCQIKNGENGKHGKQDSKGKIDAIQFKIITIKNGYKIGFCSPNNEWHTYFASNKPEINELVKTHITSFDKSFDTEE